MISPLDKFLVQTSANEKIRLLKTEDTEIVQQDIYIYLSQLAKNGLQPNSALFSSKFIENGKFKSGSAEFIREMVKYVANCMKLFAYLAFEDKNTPKINISPIPDKRNTSKRIFKDFSFNPNTNSFAWEDKILNKSPRLISQKELSEIYEYKKKYRSAIDSNVNIRYRMNSLARAMIMVFREDIKMFIYQSALKNFDFSLFIYQHPGEVLKFIAYDRPLTDFKGDYISKSIINTFIGYQNPNYDKIHYHTWHSALTDIIRLMNLTASQYNPISKSIVKIDKNTKPIEDAYLQLSPNAKKNYQLSGHIIALLESFMYIDTKFPQQPDKKISYIMLLLKELAEKEKSLPSLSEYIKKILQTPAQIPLDKSITKNTPFNDLINMILNAIKNSEDAKKLFGSVIEKISRKYYNYAPHDTEPEPNTTDTPEDTNPSDKVDTSKEISMFTLPNVQHVISKYSKKPSQPETPPNSNDQYLIDEPTDTYAPSYDDDDTNNTPPSPSSPPPPPKPPKPPKSPRLTSGLDRLLKKYPPGYKP